MAVDLRVCKVLVTPTSYARHDARLGTELEAVVGEVVYSPVTRPLTSAEVGELLVGVDGFIAGLDVIDPNPKQVDEYTRFFPLFESAYQALLPVFDEMSALP